MAITDTLITDRVQADVIRAKYLASLWTATGFTGTAVELAEWESNLKGAYNAADMNRVGAAVAYVAGRLTAAGYSVAVAAKQDWQDGDTPTVEARTAYMADITVLRGVLAVMPVTPPVPADMLRLTYQEANAIEQILKDLDFLITNMIAAVFYSGELYSGEV